MNEADALATIAKNVDAAKRGLALYAAHWAARYSGPVYLVGSTLYRPAPRDCDIRIVVADHEFAARFGHELVRKEKPYRDRPEIVEGTVVDWQTDGPTQRWIDDVAKFSAAVSLQLRLNMDIQIWPESYWRKTYPPPILLAAPSPQWFFYKSEVAQ